MSAQLPVLIVDKKGIIGSLVAQKISSKNQIVLVSRAVPSENENIIHVPFTAEIPTVPDNTYSHILFVDDGNKITRESLEAFFKKSKEDNSDFVFATFLGNISEKLHKNINSYQNSKIVLIGEVFDEEYIVEQNTPTTFIEQIRNEGKIEIKGDGMNPTFPVLLEDVVESLSKIIFEKKEAGVIFLFPKSPITHLSLAHLFQKQNPLIKIDFKSSKASSKNQIAPAEGKYYLGDSLDLSEKVKKINLDSKKKTTESKVIENPRSFRKLFLLGLLSVIFLIFLPFIATVAFSAIGASELSNAKKELFSGNLSQASKKSQNAVSLLNIAETSASVIKKEANLFGQEEKADAFFIQIENLSLLSKATSYLIDAITKFSFISESSTYEKKTFLEGSSALKNSITIYRQLQTKQNLPSKIKEEISEFSSLIDILDVSIDYLPKILGFEKERSYLLLFHNNMELRPGGGFIGSYAKLNIKNSKISNFKIYDVYDADGQLKEHLEPPFPIRRYLPSAHFFLRDSNFYLNFSDNALSAQNFLYLEKKEKFDGVIALDVSFTREILDAIGGVDVPNYNVRVTGENFFELADKYSRNNFFPGSTQKKDFLGSVFNSIQLNLNNKNTSYLKLARAVSSGISQKHIQVYFNDPAIQNTALLSGVSPAVLDTRRSGPKIINDYSGIVEANLGVNKVNKDVGRSISKNAVLKDGKILSTITAAYKNNSKKEAYKNYIRFIVPLGSTLEEIKINGKEQETIDAISDPGVYEKKDFKPPKELEVLKDNQSGKTVFGFLLSIPRDSIKTVSLTYLLPSKTNTNSSEILYSLKFLKQSGTEDYPFGFELKFPEELNMINSNQNLNFSSGKISYQTQLEKDIDINLALSPK